MPFPSLSLELQQVHWEELQILWERRQTMLRSPLDTLERLADVDDRIEAHLYGLLLDGEAVTPLVESGLEGDEALPAFAAALTLLRLKRDSLVLDAFRQAEGGRLEGIRQAFCSSASTPAEPLRSLLTAPAAATAVAAAEVLAFHQAPECRSWPADRLLRHESPALRCAAWRVVSLGAPCTPESYQTGLHDEEESVRRAALEAAAWRGHPGLLDHCRAYTARPLPAYGDALLLLAILGGADQLARILDIGRAVELGAMRFRILGAFGHPGVVELLLQGMESKDPRTAVAAGAAFMKITGTDIASNQRVLLPPEDGHEPDEFEREFLDEAFLPSLDLARFHWQRVEPHFCKGTRWCRGRNLSAGGSPDLWNRLDMESRWEAYLRGRFTGQWSGGPVEMERFPQDWQ